MPRPRGVRDHSPDAKANRSVAQRAAWANGNHESTRQAQIAAWNPEKRARMAEYMRQRWADPKYRARVAGALSDVCNRPEYRENLSRLRRGELARRRGRPSLTLANLVKQLL